MKYFLAIDLGASSGRHIIGYLENGQVVTKEIYRFSNGNVIKDSHLTWDIEHIFEEVKKGIKKCLEEYHEIESFSIDTWGVDYVLLKGDEPVYPVFAYRDDRTKAPIEKVHEIISFDELYEITGLQFQPFNTIYQLYCDKLEGRLEGVTDFLHISEYLLYRLTGKKVKEYTMASTTGMLDLNTNDFSSAIIEKLGFEKSLFKPLYKQGFVIGDLTPEVQSEIGGNVKAVLCSTHDTGAAVEGIPFEKNVPYISSGTWSILGIKLNHGINSKTAQNANYSNEYGPNYIRFQTNIMGLWIIQNLAKQLNRNFVELVEDARQSNYQELYSVNDQCFLNCSDMKTEIIKWFKDHNKPLPKEDKDIVNTTYRSLAYNYSIALKNLETITGQTFDSFYIVGGGAKNAYLNELTELYTHKKVIALPIEASSIGNILGQIKE